MCTSTTRWVMAATGVLLTAATLALAGCHHNQDAAGSGGGPTPQQEQQIQQNAAARSAAMQNAPQMGTEGGGAAPGAGVGANHP